MNEFTTASLISMSFNTCMQGRGGKSKNRIRRTLHSNDHDGENFKKQDKEEWSALKVILNIKKNSKFLTARGVQPRNGLPWR